MVHGIVDCGARLLSRSQHVGELCLVGVKVMDGWWLPCTTSLACKCFHDLICAPRPAATCAAGGVLEPGDTMDREEAAECEKMQGIMAMPGMEGNFRWIVAQVGVREGGHGSVWLGYVGGAGRRV